MNTSTLDTLYWFLNYAIHSSLIIGSIWVFTKLWPTSSSATRNALWKIAVFAPVFTSLVGTLTPQFSLFDPMELDANAKMQRNEAQQNLEPLRSSGLHSSFLTKETLDQRHDPMIERDHGVNLKNEAIESQGRDLEILPSVASSLDSSTTLDGSEERGAPSSTSAALMLACVALLGWSCFSLLRGGLQIVSFRRRLADRSDVQEPALLEILARLQHASSCMRKVRLSSHDSIASPIALPGNEICIPTRMIDAMPLAQSKAAIAHELAHIQRRDPIWTLGIHIVESMFPMQPLNRLARIRHNATMELLCDDWAIQKTGEGLSLAKCLATIGQWSQNAASPELFPAMARPSQALVTRVDHALSDKAGTLPQRAGRWAGVTGAVCLGALVAFTPSFAPASPDLGDAKVDRDELEPADEKTDEEEIKSAPIVPESASVSPSEPAVALADEKEKSSLDAQSSVETRLKAAISKLDASHSTSDISEKSNGRIQHLGKELEIARSKKSELSSGDAQLQLAHSIVSRIVPAIEVSREELERSLEGWSRELETTIESSIPDLKALATQRAGELAKKGIMGALKGSAMGSLRANQAQTLPLISELDISSRMDVQVKIDPKVTRSELSIDATQAQLQKVVVTQNRGRLSLSMKRGASSRDMTAIRVKLTTRSLRSIDVSGASSLHWSGENDSSTMAIDLSGVARVKGRVKSKAITLDLSGASRLSLGGSSKALRMDTSGASVVDLAQLNALDTRIDASGASSISTCTRQTLQGRLIGASVVHERCEPKTIKVDTSGAGRVVTK